MIVVRLIAWQTVTFTGQKVPATVSLAQVGRSTSGRRRHRVSDADAVTLDYRRDLTPSRSLRERGQWRHHGGTRDIEHADREERCACALVAKHQIHAATDSCAENQKKITHSFQAINRVTSSERWIDLRQGKKSVKAMNSTEFKLN